MNPKTKDIEIKFSHTLFPVIALLIAVTYGLVMRPLVFDLPAFPVEFIFVFAAIVVGAELLWLGFKWDDIQVTIIEKMKMAIPAFLILFTIGIIIGSWMISGTIPMLVYYGLEIINPTYMYVLSFWIAIIFSLMTGTSWGSIGSIGVVLIGISGAMGANIGITAGAIVGGAFFGDKMSPLSDTTNVAAIATEINLFDHIQSMMYTTVPSAIITSIIYIVLGFVYQPEMTTQLTEAAIQFNTGLEQSFNFNILLLIPPLIILFGSANRKPIMPTMIISMVTAVILTFLFQDFTVADTLQSLIRGFDTSMITSDVFIPEGLKTLLNRGGLYALTDAIVISFTVFIFIGAMSHINAMPRVVDRVFRFSKTAKSTILSALAATAVTNAFTANQYATSFIVGGAFNEKFDNLGIHRKVLSRSIEDTGTMLESIVPWHPSCVFAVVTLGVTYGDFWHWHFMALTNIAIAPLFAFLGIAVFKTIKKDT
jgi:NhaC family Na+:H+ antiporter